MSYHEVNLNNGSTKTLYTYIRYHGGISNFHFQVIHQTFAFSVEDVYNIRRKWINEYKPTLNMVLPRRTPRQCKLEKRKE